MLRTLTCFIFTAALASLPGCGSASTQSTKQASSRIDVAAFTGRWNLDTHASDDVKARLQPLFERNEKKWKRNAERFEEPPPRENDARSAPADEGVSNIRWLIAERQKEIQAWVAFAMPATQVDVRASEREVRLGNNKGEGTRVFVPGEPTTLFVTVGGFTVASAWRDAAFTIDSRGQGENKARVVEQYRLSADSTQLEERLEVRFPTLGKQVFKFVYRRG